MLQVDSLQRDWDSLRQFTNWWWRAGQPYDMPSDPVRRHAGSQEMVLFRRGQFQVEQIILFPGHPVPRHRHPNVETYESHLTGTGCASVDGKKIPSSSSARHYPKYRRLYIGPRMIHYGQALTVNVALSFQRWIGDSSPTFITDDWEGRLWPA